METIHKLVSVLLFLKPFFIVVLFLNSLFLVLLVLVQLPTAMANLLACKTLGQGSWHIFRGYKIQIPLQLFK